MRDVVEGPRDVEREGGDDLVMIPCTLNIVPKHNCCVSCAATGNCPELPVRKEGEVISKVSEPTSLNSLKEFAHCLQKSDRAIGFRKGVVLSGLF